MGGERWIRLALVLVVVPALTSTCSCSPSANVRAVFAAVRNGNAGAVRDLLDEDPSLANAKESDGWSVLDEAIYTEHIDLAQLIAARGAEQDIHTAAALGDLAVVKRLAQEDPTSIYAWSAKLGTPLHKAARWGRDSVTEFLVESGADLNETGGGRTQPPIVVGAMNGNAFVVRILLDHGATADCSGWPEPASGPLPIRPDILSLLVGKAVPRRLHVAVRLGSTAAAESILRDQPGMVNEVDESGDTPLYVAAELGEAGMVELLLDRGAHMDGRNHEGETALHVAALYDRKAAADLLIARGANVNSVDDAGETPLHEASFGWSAGIVKLLIAHGADVNARTAAGRTPLHYAAWRDAGLVRLLLAAGADIDAMDSVGQTPLHAAAYWDRADIAAVLIQHVADITVRDSNGRTPLALARIRGSKEVARLISDQRAATQVER